MSGRRELRLALALCLLGSGLVLWAVGQTWVVELDPADLTISGAQTSTPGSDLATAARPLSVVGLAGVLAVAATRRWGRLLVGLVLLGAGTGAALDVVDVLRGGDLPLTSAGWAWLALAGCVLLVLGGLLVAVRGHRWSGLSASYEPPGAAPEPPVTDKGVWDALDRGDDPTA